VKARRGEGKEGRERGRCIVEDAEENDAQKIKMPKGKINSISFRHEPFTEP